MQTASPSAQAFSVVHGGPVPALSSQRGRKVCVAITIRARAAAPMTRCGKSRAGRRRPGRDDGCASGFPSLGKGVAHDRRLAAVGTSPGSISRDTRGTPPSASGAWPAAIRSRAGWGRGPGFRGPRGGRGADGGPRRVGGGPPTRWYTEARAGGARSSATPAAGGGEADVLPRSARRPCLTSPNVVVLATPTPILPRDCDGPGGPRAD